MCEDTDTHEDSVTHRSAPTPDDQPSTEASCPPGGCADCPNATDQTVAEAGTEVLDAAAPTGRDERRTNSFQPPHQP